MKKLIIIAGALLLLASCGATHKHIVTNAEGSKSVEVDRTVFFNIALGNTNNGIAANAKKAGISTITAVDYNVTKILFVTKYKTIITGE